MFNGSRLIVDWHNYGYSILALSLGKAHVLVKIARWLVIIIMLFREFDFACG